MSPADRIDGRFRLLALAGSGAAGAVYRAIDERTNTVVALKLLAGVAGDLEAERRFDLEVQVLATVSDPHVVHYVAHGHDHEGSPYLVVDWLEGEDLSRRARKEPISAGQALSVVKQAARGLSALHAAGVVHRDVKPSNLMLSPGPDPHVTLIDLGVAHLIGASRLTQTGTILGTPHFMSPEQVLGKDELTAASDVFSLAVVLFELLTGERAYSGKDAIAVIAKIALQDPPRLSNWLANVPNDLAEVMARAMAKRATERMVDAAEFVAALENIDALRVQKILSRPNASKPKPDDVPTQSISESVAFDAEQRIVTALFIRLRESEQEAELDTIIASFGGRLHRLLSLANIAVFGADVSVGDEPLRAARAALALRRTFPSTAVALSTGRVLTGSAELSGDAIDRGAHVLAQATESGVLLDETTARLLGGQFELDETGEIPALLREQGGTFPSRGVLGKRLPCLGRESEVAWLRSRISKSIAEKRAQALSVVGPPGIGKSRILEELFAQLAESDTPVRVLLGRASSIGAAAPFGVLSFALTGVMQGGATQIGSELPGGQANSSRGLGRTLRAGEQARLVPLLAELATVAGTNVTRAGDAVLVSDRLRAAFENWLDSLTQTQPVVFVVDGLQWADPPSLKLLAGALRAFSARPLIVVGLGRSEPGEASASLELEAEEFSVGPLPAEAGKALARWALGPRATEEIVARLVARAGGNPFFLEELLRSFARRSADSDTESDWAWLPETVLGVVQSRLDALGPAAKRLLKAASVIGETFWFGAARAVVGSRDIAELDQGMRSLASLEVLEWRSNSRFAGEVEISFKSTLVRDVAYALLQDEERSRGHLVAAQWLLERDEASALEIARHFDLGADSERAANFFALAAEQALVGNDLPMSISCCERGLLRTENKSLAGRLHLTLAEALRWSGEIELGLMHALSAHDELPAGSVLWFGAIREAIAAHGRLGHQEAIGPLAMLALQTEANAGAESAQIAALVPAAVHMLYVGEVAVCQALASQIELCAQRAPTLMLLARARLHQLRAALALHHGDLERAVSEQYSAEQAYESLQDTRALALVLSNLGFTLLSLGALERAETVLRHALSLAQRHGLATVEPLVLQNLGMALARRGDHQGAIELQTQAIAQFEARKDPRLALASRVHLGLAHLARREMPLAKQQGELVRDGQFEPLKVGGLALLSMVALASGESQQATALAGDAVRLLERLGQIEEFSLLAKVAWAEALYANGEGVEALRTLSGAKRELDTTFARLRDPELRDSFWRGVPEHARIADLTGR